MAKDLNPLIAELVKTYARLAVDRMIASDRAPHWQFASRVVKRPGKRAFVILDFVKDAAA